MPNTHLHATNVFPANGAQTEWDFNFDGVNPDNASGTRPYLYPEDVRVQEQYTDANGARVSVDRERELIAPNRVRVLGDPIANGRQVRIFRETENRFPLVDYRDRQTVTEADLDLQSRQTLFVAVEAFDLSTQATATANEANQTANEANITAERALQVANQADQTANAANQTSQAAAQAAANAVQAAADATAAAAEAAADAESVRGLAQQAGESAAAAADSAEAAAERAAVAVQTANSVDAKATQALTNSQTALTRANAATATANGVDAKATQALTNSQTALSTANAASATANGVDSKAQQALDNSATAVSAAAAAREDVQDLSVRVESAESAVAATQSAVGEVSSALLAETQARISERVWANQPVGVPFPMWDHLVSPPPMDSELFRFVKLTASDAYNSGVLVDETITGTAPLVVAQATVDDPGSPLNGAVIHLLNTERRFLRAGAPGEVEMDALQNITGRVGSHNATAATGAFAVVQNTALWGGQQSGSLTTVSFDASRVVRTGDETRPKNVSATYYMRIK